VENAVRTHILDLTTAEATIFELAATFLLIWNDMMPKKPLLVSSDLSNLRNYCRDNVGRLCYFLLVICVWEEL